MQDAPGWVDDEQRFARVLEHIHPHLDDERRDLLTEICLLLKALPAARTP